MEICEGERGWNDDYWLKLQAKGKKGIKMFKFICSRWITQNSTVERVDTFQRLLVASWHVAGFDEWWRVEELLTRHMAWRNAKRMSVWDMACDWMWLWHVAYRWSWVGHAIKLVPRGACWFANKMCGFCLITHVAHELSFCDTWFALIGCLEYSKCIPNGFHMHPLIQKIHKKSLKFQKILKNYVFIPFHLLI